MLAKTNRFQGRPSMNAVFKRGNKTHFLYTSVRFLPRPDKQPRVAIVVSKKVHKNAVVRNKIRRAVYLFCQKQLQVIKPGDIIVSVHDEKASQVPATEFEALLLELFQRAKIISK